MVPEPSPPTPGSREAIEQRVRWLETLVSTIAAGVLEIDLDGRFTYANPAALRMLGYTWSELVGQRPTELGIRRFDRAGEPVDESMAPAPTAGLAGRGTERAVLRYSGLPVPDVWLESQTAPLYSAESALVGRVVSFVDVSDRFALESARRAADLRLNEILDHTTAGILMVDPEGRIEYVNAASTRISGMQPADVMGKLVADPSWQLTDEHGVVLPYDALPVPTALRERREVRDVQLGIPMPSGPPRWMRVGAHPLFNADGSLRGAVVTTEDTTDQRALAEQLLQAQKIEGIGQLAGGIAHDFNNLLTAILGNVELALAEAGPGSPIARDLAEIRDAATRGAALTKQVLTFARKQVALPRAVHLDQLAAGIEHMLQRVLGAEISLRRESDPELWSVRIDPGQMEQVIVNMAINSRHAMPSGGLLRIETRNRVLSAADVQAHPGVEPGEFVALSVTDTGTGIPGELVARIFEPFFTTKAIGSGSGLGLSICHGIVKQARGFIRLESELGRGTTFTVHLPREREAVADASRPSAPPVARGAGTILVVEDEESVRTLVARVLRSAGYEVLVAGHGAEALALQARTPTPFDLLLCDVVMPGMRGPEVARLMRERQPGLRVLFISGYAETMPQDEARLTSSDELLQKPFTPVDLAQRVQQAMHGRP